MIIDIISDLHGHFPKLEGGDLLIVAGDLTARDTEEDFLEFHDWFGEQNYKKRIVIAGNHDVSVEKRLYPGFWNYGDYLQDSATYFEGLKVWGSPWSLTFEGMNPKCKAFTVDTDEELQEKWDLIPEDIDILITHMPPYGILDTVVNPFYPVEFEHVGSTTLKNMVISDRFKKLKYHIFGHIHECGGKVVKLPTITLINASHVNERYEPVNEPIRVIL